MNINFNFVLTVYLVFIPILVLILLALNYFLARSNPDSEKLSTYESGFSTQLNQTRQGVTVAYFIIALLFILFDLEVLLLYPITVSLDTIGYYGFCIAIIFFSILTLGFIVELSYGVLNFNSYTTNLTYSIPLKSNTVSKNK